MFTMLEVFEYFKNSNIEFAYEPLTSSLIARCRTCSEEHNSPEAGVLGSVDVERTQLGHQLIEQTNFPPQSR